MSNINYGPDFAGFLHNPFGYPSKPQEAAINYYKQKEEELRKMCFNKNNNEVLVQGRGPYSYSINIDEADDETIMKLTKLTF